MKIKEYLEKKEKIRVKKYFFENKKFLTKGQLGKHFKCNLKELEKYNLKYFKLPNGYGKGVPEEHLKYYPGKLPLEELNKYEEELVLYKDKFLNTENIKKFIDKKK